MNSVCSEIHANHINVLCGQNFEFLRSKTGGKVLWAANGSTATLLTKNNIVYISNAIKKVPINPLQTKRRLLYLKAQCKHFSSQL